MLGLRYRRGLPGWPNAALGGNLQFSKLKFSLLLFLFLVISVSLKGSISSANQKAILIGRCVGNCLHDDLTQEFGFSLADAFESGHVAIRLCSSERTEIAIAKASTNLTGIIYDLRKSHNVNLNNSDLLLSRRCTAAKQELVATEFWAIPGTASLPPHEKNLRIANLSISVASRQAEQAYMKPLLVLGDPLPDDVKKHQAPSQTEAMAQMLRSEAGSYGVVIGFYFRGPSAQLRREVRLARQELEKDAGLKGRFSTYLIPYGYRYSDSVEPNEPNLYVVRLSSR